MQVGHPLFVEHTLLAVLGAEACPVGELEQVGDRAHGHEAGVVRAGAEFSAHGWDVDVHHTAQMKTWLLGEQESWGRCKKAVWTSDRHRVGLFMRLASAQPLGGDGAVAAALELADPQGEVPWPMRRKSTLPRCWPVSTSVSVWPRRPWASHARRCEKRASATAFVPTADCQDLVDAAQGLDLASGRIGRSSQGVPRGVDEAAQSVCWLTRPDSATALSRRSL